MLEYPITSMMWIHPRLGQLTRHDACQLHVLDQCQYGAPWKKATRIAAWNTGHALHLDRRCVGKKGLCTSGKHHIVLSGASTEHGVLWTFLAQVYPNELAKHVARLITSSSIDRKYVNVGI